jgi:hypothetical protein
VWRVAGARVAGVLLLAAACRDPVASDPASSGPARAAAAGVSYYVSPSGDDAGAGTSPSSPWRTLGRVNRVALAPGDRILLQGGATLAGTLVLDSADGGTPQKPVVVTSYGGARATIAAGAGDAILIYNTGGIEIRRLVLRGSGRATNGGSGVNAYADLPGGVKLRHLRIDSVEASGFGGYGIVIGSWRGATGFRGVRVTSSSAHDNALAGFATYAQARATHEDVYFGHLEALDNPGVRGLVVNSGSGIVMGGVRRGTIERSVARDNGRLADAAEGPVGIWAYDSDSVVIQHNESYRNRTGGPADGGGFDLDQNTTNSTLQYNYSHDNHGAGYLLGHAPAGGSHAGNVVRFNVSENDARRNGFGAITLFGRVTGAEIHNNTLYVSPSSGGAPRAIFIQNATVTDNDVRGVHLRNNIVVATGGVRAVEVTATQLDGAADLRFEGNAYHGGSSPPRIAWGAALYTGVAPWRAATGQERVGGAAVGYEGDPRLTSAGGGGTIGDADRLHTLGAYELLAGSPLVGRGLDLRARFGVAPGARDFFGGAIPAGAAYDIGAHEWR